MTFISCHSIKRPYKSYADKKFKKGDTFLLPRLQFSIGGCEIVNSTEDSLKATVEFIKAHPEYVFEIDAHTGHRGDPKKNLTVTQCRAEAIKNHLILAGHLHDGSLVAKGFGSKRPLISTKEIEKAKSRASHGTEYLSMKNARIELKILLIKRHVPAP